MKQSVILTTVLCTILLSACSSNNTESYRSEYMASCKQGGAALGDKVDSYCECTFEKLVEKYPTKADMEKASQEDPQGLAEIFKPCVEQLTTGG